MASNCAYYPNGTVSDVYIGAGLYNGSQTAALHQNTTINSRLQVTGRTATSLVSGSTNILSLGFNYPSSPKNNGNLTTQSITTDGGFGASGLSATQYYGYDPFNRLTSMTESSTSGCPNGGALCQTFQYDAYGNRAVTAGYIPSPTLTPTAASQFTGNRWLGSGSTTASYDAAGNQINTNGAGNAFTYDAEDRMISANIANMGATTYAYDGDGRRVQKVSSTYTSYYVYDAGGSEIAEYTSGPQPNYGTLYVTADHLGSTRVVTDGNGNVVRRYDYLPFGEEIPAGSYSRGADYGGNSYPNAGGTSFPGDAAANKFTGKERDWETGLDYFGARYFSSAQGRFTSPDEFKGGGLFDPSTGLTAETIGPLPYADITDPQTLNKYAYVRNNPLRYVDPDGHDDVDVIVKHAFEVVSTTANEAGAVASEGLGLLGDVFGAAAGILLNPGTLNGAAESEGLRRIENSRSQGQTTKEQQAAQEDEKRSPEKEAQAQTGGAGARQGGKKPPKDLKTLPGTLTQLEGVENAQQAGRAGKAPEIEHTDKSKQDLKNQLKKVKTEKDAESN